jgi:hypothetical protein
MKYKTLIRLLVKLIGIFLLISGAANLVGGILFLLITLSEYPSFGGPSLISYPLAWTVTSLLTVIASFILLFASNWLADKLIPSNRPYCPNCGYELTGSLGTRCAECGVDIAGLGLTAAPIPSAATTAETSSV